MKKLILLLLAVLMVLAMFAGCNNARRDTDDDDEQETESAEVSQSEDVEDPSDEVSVEAPETSEVASSGSAVVDSYTAFINAKTPIFTKISDGLSSNPDTMMASMSMLGFAFIDLYLIPVAFFGQGEEVAAAGLAMMGAEGVQYSESGNTYTVTYTDSEGVVNSLTGTWDAAADSLVCVATADGVENFYSEYRKTSYGYVSQYYFANDDGSQTLYLVTVDGEDGALGLTTVTEKPAALTGSEPVDYPSSCTEWYAISGSTITGMTSDGTAVNFEYVPTESAES